MSDKDKDGEDTGHDAFQLRDPDKFATNLARVVEEAGKAWSAYLEPRERGDAPMASADELAQIVKTLNQVSEYWLSDPKRMLEAQSRLMTSFLSLWSSSIRRFSGDAPPVEEKPADKRFADPEWSRNEFFSFLRDMYLATTKWADDLVDEASDLDEHTRAKAGFYIKQIGAALSPTNFVMTNPELLRETLAQDGENLVKGMKMLAEDIRRGHGDLKLRQSDPSKFKVGVNMAVTPGKVVMRNDICELLHYEPTTEKALKRPLLIVPPWINKF
ncbi:MAG: class I poly(R)-hydroxyalkanoic acid synthase, partial [Hyphomicrobiaceae bacterium]|nr:class I poly(R)-hydroxyalkanoic acid synthase [Hyphomicrobiaceae bacterium]